MGLTQRRAPGALPRASYALPRVGTGTTTNKSGAGGGVGVRWRLSGGQEGPLREALVEHVSRRSVRRVLRVGAAPTVSDRLTSRLKAVGARTVPVALERPEVSPEVPRAGAVVFEAPGLEDTMVPYLQSLTRIAGKGQLLIVDVPQHSEIGARLLSLRDELTHGATTRLGQHLVDGLMSVEVGPVGKTFDVLITLKRQFYLVLTEREANERLQRTPAAGRVVSTIPAADTTNTSIVEQSPAAMQHTQRVSYSAPELTLRLYHDVTAFPRQILTQPGLVLPDSFRKPWKVPPTHRTLDPAPAEIFTRPPFRRARDLPGSYFYLDSEFGGHFGHALTEQLSRLWAWRTVKEQDPDAKCLMVARHPSARRPARTIAGFERLLYGAAGVAPEDLVLVHGGVNVERMYAATPMFAQPEYVHPRIADVWREVGDRLAAQADERERPRRIFCARKHGKRACRNGVDVERLFADNGFSVIYPEDYPMPEQVALFRNAEVVAGYAGSALFTAMFCPEPTRVIMISSENYTAQNEYVIAAVLGHRLSVAWCRPDLQEKQASGFDKDFFQSDYTFDFAREGRFLDEVFAQS